MKHLRKTAILLGILISLNACSKNKRSETGYENTGQELTQQFDTSTINQSFKNTDNQIIIGKWHGALDIQGTQLRLIFNITKNDNGYSSTMDSPDQGAKGIPIASTSFENLVLKISLPNAGIEYTGTLGDDNVIRGTFNQMGASFPLNLSKKEIKHNRPQEPKKPYPYHSEEVTFENTEEDVTLAGTLTLPEKSGSFPAVILITGSGPQNRDEEIFGHKPFLVLADYLTKKGIAVLRFDDRGVGKSTGNFETATTFDFATDIECALKYLQTRKEINKNKIGLIGHSEGGVIAPIVASTNEDIAFIVLMAGSALRGDKLLLLQKYKLETQMGINDQAVNSAQEIFAKVYKIILNENIEKETLADTLSHFFMAEYGDALPENERENMVSQLASPWWINFIRLDPKEYLEKVSCPLLAINGSKDLQIPAKENLEVIRSTCKNVTVKELQDLNHLFQECQTGLPDEYGSIEQTLSPIALKEISEWISKLKY